MLLTCHEVRPETADVTSFLFNSDQAVDFIPGQFLTLLVPIEERTSARAYSLSSIPGDERLKLTIKRVPGGRVSNHLLDALKPGDQLEAMAPAGEFHRDIAGSGAWLLLSAGCGITPVFSMLRERLQREPDADIVFVHSARSEADKIFPQELEALAAEHPNLKLHWVLGDNTDPDPFKGRLDLPQLQARVPDMRQRTAMICGPQGYMDAVKEMLRTEGLAEERIHSEAFVAPEPASVASSDAAGHNLSVDGIELPILPGQTVLDSLEKGGLPIFAACRTGVCGSCKCKGEKEKLESTSVMGLTPEEIEEGYFLACSSTVTGDMALELND
ncbi:hybrid-cluster NAD(P)-dependent oxidoreductase [Ferrimonas balearica]|uniref:hybrid-cluster NAD(P)-dependent oxidoreductase n=1 Tax=Ferrimonas balearica TaxID=44012 RepID=UPI001C99F7B6|nr:hybrid-cluster NAD(P)-dependent oxidoreductase [Ferrimonas balearica]MBY5922034.1 hybrid-cluster NAD(P)-dependent oxidoreductase [Ferrimonas balearica]MBY5994626.1 hybrid-cluster NAD(P)-dependent oxidoreductase [Ferrimonas balearica]